MTFDKPTVNLSRYHQFSAVFLLFYTPTSHVLEFQFLLILTNIIVNVQQFLIDCCLYFSDDNIQHFFLVFIRQISYFVKYLFQSLAYFLRFFFVVLVYNLKNICSWYQSFIEYVYCKYLLLLCALPFHSFNDVFDEQMFLILMQSSLLIFSFSTLCVLFKKPLSTLRSRLIVQWLHFKVQIFNPSRI